MLLTVTYKRMYNLSMTPTVETFPQGVELVAIDVQVDVDADGETRYELTVVIEGPANLLIPLMQEAITLK